MGGGDLVIVCPSDCFNGQFLIEGKFSNNFIMEDIYKNENINILNYNIFRQNTVHFIVISSFIVIDEVAYICYYCNW